VAIKTAEAAKPAEAAEPELVAAEEPAGEKKLVGEPEAGQSKKPRRKRKPKSKAAVEVPAGPAKPLVGLEGPVTPIAAPIELDALAKEAKVADADMQKAANDFDALVAGNAGEELKLVGLDPVDPDVADRNKRNPDGPSDSSASLAIDPDTMAGMPMGVLKSLILFVTALNPRRYKGMSTVDVIKSLQAARVLSPDYNDWIGEYNTARTALKAAGKLASDDLTTRWSEDVSLEDLEAEGEDASKPSDDVNAHSESRRDLAYLHNAPALYAMRVMSSVVSPEGAQVTFLSRLLNQHITEADLYSQATFDAWLASPAGSSKGHILRSMFQALGYDVALNIAYNFRQRIQRKQFVADVSNRKVQDAKLNAMRSGSGFNVMNGIKAAINAMLTPAGNDYVARTQAALDAFDKRNPGTATYTKGQSWSTEAFLDFIDNVMAPAFGFDDKGSMTFLQHLRDIVTTKGPKAGSVLDMVRDFRRFDLPSFLKLMAAAQPGEQVAVFRSAWNRGMNNRKRIKPSETGETERKYSYLESLIDAAYEFTGPAIGWKAGTHAKVSAFVHTSAVDKAFGEDSVVHLLGVNFVYYDAAGNQIDKVSLDDSDMSGLARVRFMRSIFEDPKNAKVLYLPLFGDKTRGTGILFDRSTLPSDFQDALRKMGDEYTRRIGAMQLKRLGPIGTGGPALLNVEGGVGETLTLGVIRGVKALDGNTFAEPELYAQVDRSRGLTGSSNYKAHAYASEESPTGAKITNIKANMTPAVQQWQLDLMKAAGVSMLTDSGSAKQIDKVLETRTVEFGGQSFTVDIIELPRTAFRETTNLDKPAAASKRKVSAPVITDTNSRELYSLVERNVTTRIKNEADEVIKGIVDGIHGDERLIRALMSRGVDHRSPLISDRTLPYVASRLGSLGRIMVPSAASVIIPSGGITSADGTPTWLQGTPDPWLTETQYDEATGAFVRPAAIRANVRNGRYNLEITGDEAAVLSAIDTLRTDPRDEAARAVLALYLKDMMGQAPHGQEDFTGVRGDVVDHVIEVDGKRYFRGQDVIINRVPGGPTAHQPGYLSQPVSWVKDASGRWVPGTGNYVQFHPGLQRLQGVDYDGDVAYLQFRGHGFDSEVFDTVWTSLIERPREDAEAAIDPDVGNNIRVDHPIDSSKPRVTALEAARISEDERQKTGTPSEQYIAKYNQGAQSVAARGNIVAAMRSSLQVLAQLGGTYAKAHTLKTSDDPAVPKLEVNRSEGAPASDRWAKLLFGDVVNVVIDGIKTGVPAFIGLTESMASVFGYLLWGQTKLASRQDANDFLQKFSDFAARPITKRLAEADSLMHERALVYQEWKTANRYGTRAEWVAHYVTNGNTLTEVEQAEYEASVAVFDAARQMGFLGTFFNAVNQPPKSIARYLRLGWTLDAIRSGETAGIVLPKDVTSHPLFKAAESMYRMFGERMFANTTATTQVGSLLLAADASQPGYVVTSTAKALDIASVMEAASSLLSETTVKLIQDRMAKATSLDAKSNGIFNVLFDAVRVMIEANRKAGGPNELLNMLVFDPPYSRQPDPVTGNVETVRGRVTQLTQFQEPTPAEYNMLWEASLKLEELFADGVAIPRSDVKIPASDILPILALLSLYQAGTRHIHSTVLPYLAPSFVANQLDKTRADMVSGAPWRGLDNDIGNTAAAQAGRISDGNQGDYVPSNLLAGTAGKPAEGFRLIAQVPLFHGILGLGNRAIRTILRDIGKPRSNLLLLENGEELDSETTAEFTAAVRMVAKADRGGTELPSNAVDAVLLTSMPAGLLVKAAGKADVTIRIGNRVFKYKGASQVAFEGFGKARVWWRKDLLKSELAATSAVTPAEIAAISAVTPAEIAADAEESVEIKPTPKKEKRKAS